MDFLKKMIATIDSLPMIAKVILCIPVLDLVWSVYRLARSIVANNAAGICRRPFLREENPGLL